MQAGFTMLEAGFCRSRETVNVLVECVFDTCLCGLLYYAWGYAFMFGAGNGLIGWHNPQDVAGGVQHSWFFLQHITALSTWGTSGIPVLAHWVFQFAFADCASTICSGTMIGRTAFAGDIIYSVFVSGFIYPIIGHWAWGPDGFLATMGSAPGDKFTGVFPNLMANMPFHDFAGSTVVHSIGGWIAIAGGICLGPRLGRRFKRDGGGPMLPHDLVMGVIGGFILWFGWYGFNPGSSLSAMDFTGIGRIAANTTLAASTGGLAAEFFIYFRTSKWDAGAITNGFLAGLVAITCPCYWVSPTGACCLGAIAGVIVILGMDLLEFLRIDDPIGAWPVHGLCGIWGTLSLGLFATGQYAIAGSSNSGVPSPHLQGGRRPDRPVLPWRLEVPRSPVHRQLHHLRQHVRRRHARVLGAGPVRPAPHQPRGRVGGDGHPRARLPGLPRVRHLGPGRPRGQPAGHGRRHRRTDQGVAVRGGQPDLSGWLRMALGINADVPPLY